MVASRRSQSVGPFKVRDTQDVRQLATDINRQLAQISTFLDDRFGYRGPVQMHSLVDTQGHPIRNVGTPSQPTDAQQYGLSLSLDPTTNTYNGQGKKLTNIAPADSDADAVQYFQFQRDTRNAMATTQGAAVRAVYDHYAAQMVPLAVGSAAVPQGSSMRFALEDHVHPGVTQAMFDALQQAHATLQQAHDALSARCDALEQRIVALEAAP